MADHGKKKPSWLLRIFMAIEVHLILILLFVPFGFDKPSSWGLDFGHFIVVAGAYVLSIGAGLVIAGIQRKWMWILLQLLPIVIFAVYLGVVLYADVAPRPPDFMKFD